MIEHLSGKYVTDLSLLLAMRGAEIKTFLTHLAVDKNVASSTQNYVFSLLKHTPSAPCSFCTTRYLK